MTVFVDTGVFYAHHDVDANRHEAAVGAFDRLLDGEFGQPYTSDYVYDETVTLTRKRTGSVRAAEAVGNRILGEGSFPRAIELRHVSPELFRLAIDAFERYDDHSLSFTDATTVALVEHYGIDRVLSFDDDLDGLVERKEPGA